MRPLLMLLALATITTTTAGADTVQESHALQAEARALVSEFVGALKPQLQSALQAGGPAQAIAVCADIAPQIADTLSVTSGWTVKRVSLKARNASRALPDEWEREMLELFDLRQAAGEPPDTLWAAEHSDSRYRYLQAQGVEPVCLMCHGAQLSEAVQAALANDYPDDKAQDYQLGEVRGAISLSNVLKRVGVERVGVER